MTTLTIKYLASGGVITNYHCVSSCGHCLYNCSPRRPKGYMDEALAEKIFRRITHLGCRSVHIGGGEPLLNPKKLMAVLSAARRTGVNIDYVETNSAWYTTPEQAERRLEKLLNKGVNTLLVSISPFHNAHIPYDRVNGVIDACRRKGMTVMPWVNAFVRDLTRLDTRRPHSMNEFETAFGPGYLTRIPDRYWIHLGGRALQTFGDLFPQRPVEQIIAESPRTCARTLSDTGHFHIDLFGNYIPGLCAGLAVSMDDLGGSLPRDKYPILQRLASKGIGGLLEMARQFHGYDPRRKSYLNHCHLCTEIRHYLQKDDQYRFVELAPKGFYDELPLLP